MSQSNLHKVKRIIQKLYIKAHKKFSITEEKSVYENDCIRICKKLLNLQNSILLISPISNKRYIRNDEHQIYIIIEGRSVNIINHTYSYVVYLDEKSLERLLDMYNTEVERRREEFEKEMTSNIKHSLQSIIHSIHE